VIDPVQVGGQLQISRSNIEIGLFGQADEGQADEGVFAEMK
jgi:hypothetical protein